LKESHPSVNALFHPVYTFFTSSGIQNAWSIAVLIIFSVRVRAVSIVLYELLKAAF
jgi:hypothetical protein